MSPEYWVFQSRTYWIIFGGLSALAICLFIMFFKKVKSGKYSLRDRRGRFFSSKDLCLNCQDKVENRRNR